MEKFVSNLPNSSSVSINNTTAVSPRQGGSSPSVTLQTTLNGTGQVSADMIFRINASPALAISQTVTLAQSKLLAAQQLIVLQHLGQFLIFQQAALNTSTVSLPPALVTTLAAFIRQQQKDDTTQLPKAIIKWLSAQLSMTDKDISRQLLSFQLKGQELLVQYLAGQPVTEITRAKDRAFEQSSAIGQLFSLFLSLEQNAKSYLRITEQDQASSTVDPRAASIGFEFTIVLEQVGTVVSDIQLQAFSLTVSSTCSNDKIKTLFEQHLPLLQQRFEQLGFNPTWQVAVNEDDRRLHSEGNPKGIINIKV